MIVLWLLPWIRLVFALGYVVAVVVVVVVVVVGVSGDNVDDDVVRIEKMMVV